MSANGGLQRGMEGHRVRECLSLGSGLEQPFPSLATSVARSLGSSLEQPFLETTPAYRRRIFLSTCSLNSFSSGPATFSPTRRKLSLSLCSLNSNLDVLDLDGAGSASRSWRRSTDLPEMSGGWARSAGNVHGLSPTMVRRRVARETRKSRSLSGSRSSSLLFADNAPPERHPARAQGLQLCRQGKKGRKTYSIYSGGQKKRVGGKVGRRKRSGQAADGSRTQQSPPTIVVQQCADSAEVGDNHHEEAAAPKKGLCLLKLSEVIGRQEGNNANNKVSKRKVGAQTLTKKKGKPMSHIRAKWLLGLSLTMKVNAMSPDLLQQQVHTKKQSLREPESEGRRALFRKMSGLPEVKEAKINVVLEKALLERARKKKEVEDAARYFKTRLRIAELCSDNSWGKARAGK